MPDPTKNVRKGAKIGIIIGFFAAALANGWMILSIDPDTTLGMAKFLVWILPGITGVAGLLHLFKVVKVDTTIRGFLSGFTGITAIINVVVLGFLPAILTRIQTLIV